MVFGFHVVVIVMTNSALIVPVVSVSDVIYCGATDIAELKATFISLNLILGTTYAELASKDKSDNCTMHGHPEGYNGIYIFGVLDMQESITAFQRIAQNYHNFHSSQRRIWVPATVILIRRRSLHPNTTMRQIQERLMKEFSKIYGQKLTVASEIFIVVIGSFSSISLVLEIYGIGEKLIVNRVTDKRLIDRRLERRRNFDGITLRGISARDPTSKLKPPKYGSLNPLKILDDGAASLIFAELQLALNFTSTIEEGEWISRFKNGTLKGITVQRFREKITDIFIGMASLLPYRATELSFLQPQYWNSVNAFFIQPPASSFRDLILDTFPTSIWVSCLAVYLVLMASISVISKRFKEAGWSGEFIRKECLLWAIGTLCQRGWHFVPIWTPLRLLFLTGYMTGLLMYVAFSTAVVSFLAVQVLPINSRSDLLKSSLPIYADSKSSTMAYIVQDLKQSTNAKFGPPVSIDEGIENLKTLKPCAFLAFPFYFYLLAADRGLREEWVCEHLSVVPVTLSPTPHAMIVGKNSPYFEMFNFILIRRMQCGLNHRFVTQYNTVTNVKCMKNPNGNSAPISMGEVFSSYVILAGGFFASIILCFLERLKFTLSKPSIEDLANNVMKNHRFEDFLSRSQPR